MTPRRFDSAGTLLVWFAAISAFVLCAKILSGGFIQAGDALWHYSNELHLLRSVQDRHGLFACLLKGMGLPLGNAYQPLLYLCVVLMHICVPWVSVFWLHNVFVCVLFTVYPLAVWFLARSFRCTKFHAGVASVISLLPVSGWGHTLDAYFWVGLHTQLIGTAGFAVALGSLNRLLWSRRQWRYLWVLAGSFAAVAMGHAVLAVLLAYTVGLYLLVVLLWRGFGQWAHLIRKTVIASVVALMLIGFWLIPFIQFNKQYKFIPEYERSFSPLAVSLTVKETVETFFYGELLDTNHPESPLFGGGEEGFRWSLNVRYNRFWLFTIYTVTGIIFVLSRRRRWTMYFWVCAFLWGAVLFVGKDDIPLLRFLPFSSNFQPIRAIYLIELSSVMLASFAVDRVVRWVNARCMSGTRRIPGCIAMAVVVVSLLIPLYERYSIASVLVGSAVTPQQQELIGQYTAMEKQYPFNRIYFGSSSGIRLISLRALADCFFLNNVTGHDNDMAGSLSWLINDIQDRLFDQAGLLELLGVSHITGQQGWYGARLKLGAAPIPGLTRIAAGNFFDQYRIDRRTEPLAVCWKRPVLVSCSDTQWYQINNWWLDSFIEHGYKLAPMIRAPQMFAHLLNPALFAGVFLLDMPATARTRRLIYKQLKDYVAKGGTLLSNKPLWDIPVEQISLANQHKLSALLLEDDRDDSAVSLSVETVSWNSMAANLTAGRPVFVYAKTAYYDQWKAHVDSRQRETFWMTPGLVACTVPKGGRNITFFYEPGRVHWVLLVCGWLGCIGMVFLLRRYACTIVARRGWFDYYHVEGIIFCYSMVRVFILAAALWFGAMYAAQSAGKLVPPVYPFECQRNVNPYAAEFRWNDFKRAATYEMQIAGKDGDFSKPVFRVTDLTETSVGYRGLTPFTWYTWRVRTSGGTWCDARRFRTGGYVPVVLH